MTTVGGRAVQERLCSYYVNVGVEDPEPECKYNGCRFQHSLPEYLANKPPDLGQFKAVLWIQMY